MVKAGVSQAEVTTNTEVGRGRSPRKEVEAREEAEQLRVWVGQLAGSVLNPPEG